MENGFGTLSVKRPPKLVSAGAQDTAPKLKVTTPLLPVLSISSMTLLPASAASSWPLLDLSSSDELDSNSASHHRMRVAPGSGTGGGGTLQPLHARCSQHFLIKSSPFCSTAVRPCKLLSVLHPGSTSVPQATPENPRSPGKQLSFQQCPLV